jgi:hypothetical protein
MDSIRTSPSAGALCALLVALGICMASGHAHAAETMSPRRYHALLVAAQKYPSLDSSKQLYGPNNDVALIRTVLLRQGFVAGNIKVLADGVQFAAGPPTRDAIIRSLQEFAAPGRLSPGDFLYLHFAGHGSQQPTPSIAERDVATRETDALDEIFLPVDIGKWDGAAGTVRNAIVDDDIGELLTAIRSRGVLVWLVFDSCHSGNMARGFDPDGETARLVRPSELGIPAAGGERSRGATTDALVAERSILESPKALPQGNGGGYVGFFGAQTTETAPELRLPAGAPDRQTYGLFSYALARALETAGLSGASYRQLSQSVLQYYAGLGRNAPTPLFEGDMDEPIFGLGAGRQPVRQWPLTAEQGRLEVSAGAINEVGPGTILAVVPTPLARNEDAIGVVRVSSATPLTSRVEWVGDPAVLQSGRVALPPGVKLATPSQIPAGAYARLLASPVSFVIRVARPRGCLRIASDGVCVGSTSPSDSDVTGLSQAAAALERAARTLPGNLTVVAPGESSEIALIAYQKRLWFVPPSGEIQTDGAKRTYSIPLDGNQSELDASLSQALVSMAKVINLSRLSGELNRQSAGLSTTLTVRSADSAAAPSGTSITGTRKVTSDEVPDLGNGDQLTFQFVNESTTPIDVTMLLVDANFGITAVFPFKPGESNRIEPNGRVTIPGTIESTGSSGLERMFIIAVEAQKNMELQNFAYLAQPSLIGDRKRGAGSTSVAELLEGAGFGMQGTRSGGFVRSSDASAVSITTYSWRTR